MRKTFLLFFVFSLLATSGTLYWRMAHPEGAHSEAAFRSVRGADGVSGVADGPARIERGGERTAALPTREMVREGVHKRIGALFDRLKSATGPATKPLSAEARPSQEASDRQDWAVTISIASSIISAFGALAQVWLTARSARSGG
jgi:hypothetical protein